MARSRDPWSDASRAIGVSPGGGLEGVMPPGGGGLAKNFYRNIDPTKVGTSTFQANAPTIDYQAQAANNAFYANAPSINNVDFATAINNQLGGGANPLLAQSNAARAQQQQLVGQLQDQAAGRGPGTELAKALMEQGTQANIKMGAGQIASQKGINPALAARMIGENTANLNQQAVGQGVNFGLAQQLAAQQQLGGLLGGMRGQDIQGSLGAFGEVMGGNTAQNQVMSQGQLGAQQLNAGVAAQNAQTQMQAQQINAATAAENARLAAGADDINARTAAQNAATHAKVEGGILNAAGSAVGAGGLGTELAKPTPAATAAQAHGGRLKAKPGQEATVRGDSPKNDKVPIMASEGEIVVPRTAAEDPEKAKRFIDALMAKEGKAKKHPKGYGGVLNAKRELADLKARMHTLESQVGRAG